MGYAIMPYLQEGDLQEGEPLTDEAPMYIVIEWPVDGSHLRTSLEKISHPRHGSGSPEWERTGRAAPSLGGLE
jgi:hypothetical protein